MSEAEFEPGPVGMQVEVFPFVEIKRQKIDADAVPAVGRLLDTRDESPPCAPRAGENILEEVARCGRGRRGGGAQREGEGEKVGSSRRSQWPTFSVAGRELSCSGASVWERCDSWLGSGMCGKRGGILI